MLKVGLTGKIQGLGIASEDYLVVAKHAHARGQRSNLPAIARIVDAIYEYNVRALMKTSHRWSRAQRRRYILRRRSRFFGAGHNARECQPAVAQIWHLDKLAGGADPRRNRVAHGHAKLKGSAEL